MSATPLSHDSQAGQQLPDNTYIVQIYTNFAPAESNPLLLRLEVEDSFTDCIEKTIAKLQEKHPVGVFLPSTQAEEYQIYSAGGDGYPDVNRPNPWEKTTTVRSAGLQFPYMLSLVFSPPESEAGETAVSETTPSAAGTLGATGRSGFGFGAQVKRGMTLTQEEKAAAATRRAEIEAKREENLRRIERQRVDKERNHYQHCESYEVLRREETLKKKQEAEESLRLQELQKQREELKAEVEREKERDQQFALLEKHRDEMNAKVEEEKQRRQNMLAQRERKAEEARIARDDQKRQLRAIQDQEREQRINKSFDNLIADLDNKCNDSLQMEEERLNRQRQQRTGAQQAELELHRVAQMEERRNYQKRGERMKRFDISDFERSRAEQTQTLLMEHSKLEELQEVERYQQWQASRQGALEAVQSKLELQYREQQQRAQQ